MVPAYQQSGHMVLVRTAMELAMVCLMLAGPIRGFAEVLALAEVLVGAGAVVAAAAGDFGNRFKLAINSS